MSNIKKLLVARTTNSIAFFNILGPLLLNGINFFTLPIFTRLLSQTDFGIVSIYTTWVAVVSIFVGLQTQGAIGTAFAHFDKDEHRSYLSSILTISVLSFVAVAVLIWLFITPISAFMELPQWIVGLMVLQALGAFGVTFATMKFTFEKRAHRTFLVSLVVALSTAILSVVLILLDNSDKLYRGRIVGMALPNILVGIFFILFFMWQGKSFFVPRYWKFCLPISLPLLFHGLSHILLSQSARVVIQKSYGFSQVGLYNLIFTFTQVLSILYMSLNNTWVPFYYDDVKNNDLAAIKRKSENYIFLFTCLTGGFILVSPEVLRIFADERYLVGTSLIPVMAASVYFTFLYSFPVNFQFYHRNTVAIAVGTTMAALINLTLANIFTPLWALNGAAVAMLISYIFLFFFHQIIAIKVLKQPYHYKWKPFIAGIACVGVFFGVFYLFQKLFIVRWPLAMLLGVIMLRRIYRNKALF